MATDSKDFKVKNGLIVAEGGTFGGTVTVAAPTSNTHAATKLYVDDLLAGVGGGALTVSDTPPSNPAEGDLWYNSLEGSTYVYYDSFWVETNSAYIGPTGSAGPEVSSAAVSSDITLEAAYRYFIDTSAARELTLPASPNLGDAIELFDAVGTAATNNVTVLNNSEKINGVLDSAIIDMDEFVVSFIYTGSTYGWRMI